MTQSVLIHGQAKATVLNGALGWSGSPFPNVNTPTLPQKKPAVARGGMGSRAADNKKSGSIS
ncbi:hypothetical protein [Caulobacter vibrioides]|uniref:Uncharacterized protein n=1 Tax=Caulobacter vibrioides (strain NA1000 / CB15N) TaxID=565050 RepID=A0A0H3C767_CAUVN|nr:hypothetical protein [Caulobacter vibrioides]YP_002516416.2 hypothetical protein CCNA_01043 [Caulobacter vibrioides NA1000]ACL94508.2 hypothetical protein CCNA_01043 [Caulobacter vibrioides NA1000]ATC26701.1 hypothetical protein CA608_05100 [Caulobacter vibrioides]ATC27826.1 hypothetical protein CA607_05285 [Caulobacter vibrioides]PLR16029.1 hypothetical protein CVUC_01680 [Caulobacter vibrioides]QXZ53068.1 hypothetical protein KZH45_05195 [Caulobacter vibrioides]